MTLTNEMEAAARKLHKFKPVLLSLGLNGMLPVVTDEQLAEYEGLLKVAGDEREAQVVLNYDRIYEFIREAIYKHELDPPPLFQKGHIDRLSLTFYKTSQVRVYNGHIFYARRKRARMTLRMPSRSEASVCKIKYVTALDNQASSTTPG